MATPTLDIGLIEYFSPILMFLFIFAVVYGVLASTKTLGDNKILQGLIGLVVALLVSFSIEARGLIQYMLPWFTFIFIFILLILAVYKMFGVTDSNIKNVITHYSGLHWTIAIICILIALGALANVFGQSALSTTQENGEIPEGEYVDTDTTTGDFGHNMAATFFHPKILGTLFLLIIATFAVALLTGKMRPTWPPEGFYK